MEPITIIAEAGVNHNGDINLAHQLIDTAADMGADIIKFQTWRTEKLVTPSAKMADYQVENTGENESQFAMLKRLELSYDQFRELKSHCDKQGIEFMSTPDEEESATFLNDLVSRFKIGSGEITNHPFLMYIARLGKPIILSTGMSDLVEIKQAIAAIRSTGFPVDSLTLLHATTDYPAPMKDINLRSIMTMREAFGVDIGYSDHSEGIHIPIAAIALGATLIEKHFTLDRSMKGPDHMASLEPQEFSMMVKNIRQIEIAMGDGNKGPSQAELKNRDLVRKSIFASKDIQKGHVILASDLIMMRPGTGISPAMASQLIGTAATRDFMLGDMLTW